MSLTIEDVRAAAERIRQYVHRTPMATSETLDQLAATGSICVNLLFKCENLQKAGAFKSRGATNAILTLLESGKHDASTLTVVTHSSGNHAQALARAARTLGVRCHVVMPSNAAGVKKAAVRGYGARVTECAPTLPAREAGVQAVLNEIKQTDGGTADLVHPYDDVRVVAGQGTAALELLEQAAEVGRPLHVLITPVGGGGLLSGSAVVAKATDKDIVVIGAEPKGADDASRSFETKTFVPSVDPQTIADGLRTSLGKITLPLVLEQVDAICTVSEEEIVRAMRLVYERMKLVVEPSAVVGLAVALYSEAFKKILATLVVRRGLEAVNVGIVFSGGNIDLQTISTLFGSANSEGD